MAITDNGKKLDLNKIREAAQVSRDKGTMSKSDYKKTMKGLNRIADAEKNGIDYQSTAPGRFKTVSANKPTLNQAGVGVNTRFPLFGKQVSKAMGFAQTLNLPEASAASNLSEKVKETATAGPTVKLDQTAKDDIAKQLRIGIGDMEHGFAVDAKKKTDAEEKTKSDAAAATAQSKAEAEKKMTEQVNSDVNLSLAGTDQKISKAIREDFNKGFQITDKYRESNFNPNESANFWNEGEFRYHLKKIKSGGLKDDRKRYDPKEAFEANSRYVGANSGKAGRKEYLNSREPKKVLKSPSHELNYNMDIYSQIPEINKIDKESKQISEDKHLQELKAKRTALKESGSYWEMFKVGAQIAEIESKREKAKSSKFSNGGKIKILNGGGKGVLAIQDQIAANTNKAYNQLDLLKQKRLDFNKSHALKIPASLTKGTRGFDIWKSKLKPPVLPEFNPSGTGDRRTIDPNAKVPSSVSENAPGIDKDSLINTALGAYGGLSLLKAKRPKHEKPKDINLVIQPTETPNTAPAFNAIDESVRMGTSNLRARTGSDLQSYVQGATAMVDNAGKAKAGVLVEAGRDKVASENNMVAQVNSQKQYNHSTNERFRENIMLDNTNRYAQRVAGAQGAVNNSLNYGVQKRADERNKAVELKQANGRYGTMMLSLAEALISQGYTEGQVLKKLESIAKVSKGEQSFKSGGKITSERMAVGAHQNLAKSNQEARKILAMYTKFISDASIENIRQFNRNIRAINDRRNITITRR